MSPGGHRIIIFAKAPIPGRVKTRLCPPLSLAQAANLYRSMARETLALAGACTLARVEIAYEPRAEFPDPSWMDGTTSVPFFDQGEGELGARLTHAFKRSFDLGANKVLAIGCDCPHMDPRRFDVAFRALDDHDVAIGPARDGGYYLIGLREAVPALFIGIPWSTLEVFDATMNRIRAEKLSAAVLPLEHDIDVPADLERV